ncbi:MAG: GIY-YIG nuclease family protein [Defluviitaleaceae bacterium]|nr:GIY-YIG nuclease family protein [Defluviitaleaceae bacterium]
MANEKIKEAIENLPDLPGCYIFKNESGTIIYAGKSKNLNKRVRSYFTRRAYTPPKLLKLARLTAAVEYELTRTEIEALLLEYSLIKKYRPAFNVRDKKEPVLRYLHLDAQKKIPGIRIECGSYAKKNWYGPFYSLEDAAGALAVLNAVWKTPLCNLADFDCLPANAAVPCFNGHIGKCMAPCSSAGLDAYARAYKEAVNFLSGAAQAVKNIKGEMREAAKNLDFEKAASLRDKYLGLAKLQKRLSVHAAHFKRRRVCAFLRGYHEESFILVCIDNGTARLSERFMREADFTEEAAAKFASKVFDGTREASVGPWFVRAAAEVQARRVYADVTGADSAERTLVKINKAYKKFKAVKKKSNGTKGAD